MKKQLILLLALIHVLALVAQSGDYKIIPLPTNDILFAPIQKRIYASVPSSIFNYGNSICCINPDLGTIEKSIWVGSEPDKIAISSDEKYLYVSFSQIPQIKKINLITNKIEQEVFFTNEESSSVVGYGANDIAVMPNRANTYVVIRKNTTTIPNYEGVVIMDGNKRRTNIVSGYDESKSLLFTADSTHIWGIDKGIWHKLKIDTSGISKINSYPLGIGIAQNLHYSLFDSLYYSNDGYSFDLRGSVPTGKKFATSVGYCLADPYNSNIYYLTAINGVIDIKTYNRKTQIPIDQYSLPITTRTNYIEKAFTFGQSGQIAIKSVFEIILINPCKSKATKPNINEGKTIKICPNTEVTLTASSTASRYYWSTGDTTKTIKIKEKGVYTVGIADVEGCVNQSMPITVQESEFVLPPSISRVNYDEALCKDVKAKMRAGYLNDNYKYEWSNGQKQQDIEVSQPIELTAIAISSDGCRSNPSEPYIVRFIDKPLPPKPTITVLGSTEHCSKEEVKTKLSAATGYAGYLWSTGDKTPTITVSPVFTQKYSLKVVDKYGCISLPSDTVVINIKSSPYIPNIYKEGNTLSVFSGANIQWFLNGIPIEGANQRTYTAKTNGFYSVQVTSTEGCISEISEWVNITNITSINNLKENQKFEVFPNPMQDILTVYTEGVNNAKVSLLDSFGREVYTTALDRSAVIIPTSKLISGFYTICLKNKNGEVLSIKKIIK